MHPTIEHEETILSSYLFDVLRLRLDLYDGRKIERDMIRTRGAALVLPVLEDGSIVMIRNYRFAHGERLWELPCGTLEADEDPARCVERELKEETGYTAGRIEPLGRCCSSPGITDEVIYNFLATDLTPGEQELDEHEDITVEVLSDQQVRRMAAENEIVDGKTLAALSVYWLRIDQAKR
jgi:ADP-ribose pyrophosphatase